MVLGRLFSKRPESVVGKIPPGRRVYAIGDVHGQIDLLKSLILKIQEDNRKRSSANVDILFLGDIIDRGAHSSELLFALMSLEHEPEVTILLGNHEMTMIDAYHGNHQIAYHWYNRFGGDATLSSFGVDRQAIHADDGASIVKALKKAVPRDVIEWLQKRPLFHTIGTYYFVHAGIRPGISLERQHKTDLLWIRDEFITSRKNHGAVIVHGHTIEGDEPTISANRIGIDTGAYSTGRLTALGLEDEAVWFLQAVDPGLVS